MQTIRKSTLKMEAIISISLLLAAADAGAQTWAYQSYSTAEADVAPRTAIAPGYLKLDESGDGPTIEIIAGRMNKCFANKLKVNLSKTETTTIITVPPKLLGCDEVRFVIKNDGTGGRREIKRESGWGWDGTERGLTRKQ